MLSHNKVLIVLVGLPGTGKSTFRNKLAMIHDFESISSDDYIDSYAKSINKTYNDVFEEYVAQANTLMERDAIELKVRGEKLIVWDQTNLTIKKRKKVLDKFPNYVKICVTFEIDDSFEWIKRLYKRAGTEGKYIPYHVLDNMAKSYVKPSLDEGFSWVGTVEEFYGKF